MLVFQARCLSYGFLGDSLAVETGRLSPFDRAFSSFLSAPSNMIDINTDASIWML